jgi:tetratricopeptide (TPR) repeat protein
MPHSKTELGRDIDLLIDQERFVEAVSLLEFAMGDDQASHWGYARLALIENLQENYRNALRLAEKGLSIKPVCPLLLWEKASALEGGGRYSDAIACYSRIVRRSVESLAFGPCGEGLKLARSYHADCSFYIGLCYENLGRKDRASWWYKKHLAIRSKGVPIMVNKELVIAALNRVRTVQ